MFKIFVCCFVTSFSFCINYIQTAVWGKNERFCLGLLSLWSHYSKYNSQWLSNTMVIMMISFLISILNHETNFSLWIYRGLQQKCLYFFHWMVVFIIWWRYAWVDCVIDNLFFNKSLNISQWDSEKEHNALWNKWQITLQKHSWQQIKTYILVLDGQLP